MTDFCLKSGTVLRSPKHSYTIIKVLGQGGFGITYLVEAQLRLGNIDFCHEFTVKELFISKYCYRQENSNNICCYPSFTNDVKVSKDAFIAESQRLQRLGIKHPNIVNIDEVFEANGTAYYVMEYIKGRSLADYVQSTPGGRLSFDQTAALMQPISEAVAMLHSHNLVHYDIKPQNIMIEQDSQGSLRPVLIDFGLAKHYNSQGDPTTSPVSGGYTLGYAPVEQYGRISSFQPTVDVYALAATTYFCLTGHRPANADELDLNSVRNELQRLRIVADAVKAICQALEYRPQSRPANATALTALLFGHLEPEVVIEIDAGADAVMAAVEPDSAEAEVEPQPATVPPSRRKAVPAARSTTPVQPAPASSLTPEQMYQKGKELKGQATLFAEAFKWYQKAAEHGHADAQYKLGDFYELGAYWLPRNEVESQCWYRKAFDQYRHAAGQGDADAQCKLGVCYWKGKGVQQDYDIGASWYNKGISWLYKVAEQGYADTQYKLGKYLFKGADLGILTEDKHTEAVLWYRKAAEQGHIQAQNELGWCHFWAKGVSLDDQELETQTIYWYSKAANQGYALAQNTLGECYYKGECVTKDYSTAAMWFLKAAEQGYAIAQFRLGECYYCGNGVPKDYDEAAKWYSKSAEQGCAYAQGRLGDCYMNGEGLQQDYDEAIKWYYKAAEQGHLSSSGKISEYYESLAKGKSIAEAEELYRKAAEFGSDFKQSELARCYYYGDGVPQNFSEAVYWYRKVADGSGYLACSAQCKLGECYYKGKGVPQDYSEALYWLRKAVECGFFEATVMIREIAELGNAEAQDILGYYYSKGEVLLQDYSAAAYWYRKAADQGNASGQYNLGVCYENGYGVERSVPEALVWYRKAAEQENAEAQEAVKRLEKGGFWKRIFGGGR